MGKRNVLYTKSSTELVVQDNPKSPVAEKIRTLRTNIQFSAVDKKIKTILITSAAPGEGKSWTAANLAVAFAQSGSRVLLVDADLRKGRQHKIFRVKNGYGFSNFLFDYSDDKKVNDKDIEKKNPFTETSVHNLILMTSGSVPPNPSELLQSNRMSDFVADVKENFDIVIFDGAPINVVADSVILSRIVDTTVLVTAYKSTNIKHLNDAKKAIEKVGGKIAGVVLNKMEVDRGSKEYSTYYSYYNR